MLWCRKLKPRNATKPMSRVFRKKFTQKRNKIHESCRFSARSAMSCWRAGVSRRPKRWCRLFRPCHRPRRGNFLEMVFSAETGFCWLRWRVFQKTAGDLLKMGNIGAFLKRNNACSGRTWCEESHAQKTGDQGNYFVLPSFESFGGKLYSLERFCCKTVYICIHCSAIFQCK